MKKNLQIHQYDKIFRENLEIVLPTIIKKVLGIVIVESEELPDDLQHTKQRNPDVLKKIKDDGGNTFILHIEFQLADDDEMIFRMLEYKAMLLRQYYPYSVRQCVIYLGSKTTKMQLNLTTEGMIFEYKLLSFRDLNYEIFLQGTKSEEVVFAILSNFGEDTLKIAIEKIIHKLDETSKGELTFKKHINQLRILSQLRRLDLKIEEIMESIFKYINIEEDTLFKKGIEQGIEQGMTQKEFEKNHAFVKSLLQDTDFDKTKIAKLAAVPVAFVENIAKEI